MKLLVFVSAIVMSTGAGLSAADATRTSSTATNAPSATRRAPTPPVVSPEIHADGRVTFRLRASKATDVGLSGQWTNGSTKLTGSSNSVWSATVGPIEPGVWEYSFNVDGLSMIDPGNPAIKPMREPRTSILHLPGKPALLHDFQDVPHGAVHQHTYWSKSLDRMRDLYVYTPPGYGTGSRGRLPTLYLQHGAGDNHATWVAHGKAHWILDNLIAQRRAKPMVVVMMDGHAAQRGTNRTGLDSNNAAFERDLLEDVMPFIEANYRVRTEPASRAIAGLSMGGGQALTVGLRHLDRFGWIGGFSSSTPGADTVSQAMDDAKARKNLKVLWVACGKDDFLLERNRTFIATLKEKNVPHQWELTAGGHSWPVWRTYLGEFAPKLFQ